MKELLDALKPIVWRAARFSGDEKISQFAACRARRMKCRAITGKSGKDLACPSAWTLRKTHAFQVIVHRAWEMLDILDAAPASASVYPPIISGKSAGPASSMESRYSRVFQPSRSASFDRPGSGVLLKNRAVPRD